MIYLVCYGNYCQIWLNDKSNDLSDVATGHPINALLEWNYLGHEEKTELTQANENINEVSLNTSYLLIKDKVSTNTWRRLQNVIRCLELQLSAASWCNADHTVIFQYWSWKYRLGEYFSCYGFEFEIELDYFRSVVIEYSMSFARLNCRLDVNCLSHS